MELLAKHDLGELSLFYTVDSHSEAVGFFVVPRKTADNVVLGKDQKNESMVQIKVIGDDYSGGFAQGRTMRNGETSYGFKYYDQYVAHLDGRKSVTTILTNTKGHEIYHQVSLGGCDDVLTVQSTFVNNDTESTVIEMISSFSMGNLSPYEADDSPEQLMLHRIRSTWAIEGRLESNYMEAYQLETSWANWGVNNVRYGQVGTMPVREFFPFIGVEDVKNGVCWGAQLGYGGSWQMEVYKRDQALCISGGLADREYGHWTKSIHPGESFTTPIALMTAVEGDIDKLCQTLTSYQSERFVPSEKEKEMPVIFNEFCTTWGTPSEEKIEAIAEKLLGKGIKYFVIDAGWYKREGVEWNISLGDWNPSRELFPEGMRKVVRKIKECGMIPGIWFEMEVCARDSEAFECTEMLLHRDDVPLTSGDRRFLDMTRRTATDYLDEKVIRFLKDYGFGYIKVDYNDNLGIGCDGQESFGEGVRYQVAATLDYMRRIRKEIPEVVIENCSSGGHRLVMDFLKVSDMISFSDAHETKEIPVVAANVRRQVLPQQMQIWAVVRKEDSLKRIYYSMINTFFGRMCLSGDVIELDVKQWEAIDECMDFYKENCHLIMTRQWHRYGPELLSYRHPKGWQGFVSIADNGAEAMIVLHTFEYDSSEPIEIRLPDSYEFDIDEVLAYKEMKVELIGNTIQCMVDESFTGTAIKMKCKKRQF